MKTYISIDGDDIGRKITACYIENDEQKLSNLSNLLSVAVRKITKLLQAEGFSVIFSAADGVVGFSDKPSIDFPALHKKIQSIAPLGITFSAGVGRSLREAYLALTYAKSSGKNSIADLNCP
ncbi:mCpol domain-containing protein [Corallococcus sp. BB11-1]|uniref:mCpol domain-containing protein n=1 Tax=Corallococcus sp. BB11-1 TaxID=2996783 RepID=UPI00226DD3B4|nr:mCpol domain-containing protein [Corallococcus sp. BB11-1]MCY1030676.1 mCpol domain-containing protein [Corallococcus sp. BB11-1]